MEDLKAYIESGILELYALGDLPPEERRGVEHMLEKNPELQDELNEIIKSLEIYTEKHAIEPREWMRDQVLEALDIREETVVRGISAAKSAGIKFYKYAFAASVLLLLISITAIIDLNNQVKQSNERIAVLETSNQKFANRVNYFNQKLENTQQALDVYQNPGDYKMVKLKGMPRTSPGTSMMVAFNPKKEMVMIDLASLKMPENDEQHQYQLWALVDGKPVDLGIFDARGDSTDMIRMKSIGKAQAFAVTLEPKGGSKNPTMDQMMLMGTI